MTKNGHIQKQLFEEIRKLVSENRSYIEEVAEILDISTDAVYRRSRGETPLRLEEAALLCEKFYLSLDRFLRHPDSSSDIVFRPAGLEGSGLDFEVYLGGLLQLLENAKNRGLAKVYVAAKDIPVFHLYQFPELACFKLYFWSTSIFRGRPHGDEPFSLDTRSPLITRQLELCAEVAATYAQIPTIEVWTQETALSLLKQIDYYYETGLLESRDTAIALCDKAEEYLKHLREEAEIGQKFMPGPPPGRPDANQFSLFHNDLILIDNVIHASFEDGGQSTFLVYHAIEYLRTENQAFNQQILTWLDTVIKASTPISTVAERERGKFFQRARKQISWLRERLD
jgi:hypothetical protein